MPDENISSPVATGQTPVPPDEQASAPLENSLFEKIRSAASGVFEKHGVKFRAGRGRPRKDGSPKASDVPINGQAPVVPAGDAVVAAPAAPAFDSEIVKPCVSAIVKGIFGWLKAKLRAKATKKHDAKYAAELVRETDVTDEELNALATLSEVCLKKYGVGTEYAPEVGLVAILAGVGLRFGMAFKGLDEKTGGDL